MAPTTCAGTGNIEGATATVVARGDANDSNARILTCREGRAANDSTPTLESYVAFDLRGSVTHEAAALHRYSHLAGTLGGATTAFLPHATLPSLEALLFRAVVRDVEAHHGHRRVPDRDHAPLGVVLP